MCAYRRCTRERVQVKFSDGTPPSREPMGTVAKKYSVEESYLPQFCPQRVQKDLLNWQYWPSAPLCSFGHFKRVVFQLRKWKMHWLLNIHRRLYVQGGGPGQSAR